MRLKKTIFQPHFLSTPVLKNTQKLGFSLPFRELNSVHSQAFHLLNF
jgi:hypothetical protein